MRNDPIVDEIRRPPATAQLPIKRRRVLAQSNPQASCADELGSIQVPTHVLLAFAPRWSRV
jgi:hypothetical protein